MNIIVSGWPAAGGSTSAVLLSHMLQYKYIYAGGVLKFMSAKLGDGAYGDDLINFESLVGDSWDMAWEAYREWKLAQEDRILVEGKTAGFLQKDKSNIYCIILTADLATRAIRAGTDGRDEDIEALQRRDQDVGGRWQRLYGVDIYDMAAINKNYNLHIDSSHLSIAHVLETIFNALSVEPWFSNNFYFPDLVKQIDGVAEIYNKEGKSYFLNKLKEHKLQVAAEDVLREWNSSLPQYVEKLHPVLRDFVVQFK